MRPSCSDVCEITHEKLRELGFEISEDEDHTDMIEALSETKLVKKGQKVYTAIGDEKMDIELTGTTEYYAVDIPEKNLVVTVIYMEDENIPTREFSFEVVEGDPENLTDELKEEIVESIR